ncbi:Holliday junction resolvase RecU, partial [Enterococcus faecium]
VLLWFSSLKRCFYLNSVHLIAYWDAQKEKVSLIEELGIENKTDISPRIPYLDAVDFYLSTLSIEGESKNGK